MRGDALGAQPLGQMARDPLDEAARVHEDQGRAVGPGQLGDAIVDLLPLLVGADGAQLVAQHLDGEVHVAPLAHVHDRRQRGGPSPRASGAAVSTGRTVAERPMRCRRSRPPLAAATSASSRSSDSARWAPRLSPATAWISSTMTVRTSASQFRLDSAVSRMKSDSGVVTRTCGGRRADLAALVGGGVAGAHRGADRRRGQAGRGRGGGELGQRLVQVPAHVIGQGLERRDVKDGGAVLERPVDGLAEELVETGEEGGEGLARAGRGREEDVAARRDQRPGARLNRGGLAEPLTKPALDDGVEHILSIGTTSRAGKRAPGRAVALRDLALEPRRDRRGGAGHVGLRLGRLGLRLAQQPPARRAAHRGATGGGRERPDTSVPESARSRVPCLFPPWRRDMASAVPGEESYGIRSLASLRVELGLGPAARSRRAQSPRAASRSRVGTPSASQPRRA